MMDHIRAVVPRGSCSARDASRGDADGQRVARQAHHLSLMRLISRSRCLLRATVCDNRVGDASDSRCNAGKTAWKAKEGCGKRKK